MIESDPGVSVVECILSRAGVGIGLDRNEKQSNTGFHTMAGKGNNHFCDRHGDRLWIVQRGRGRGPIYRLPRLWGRNVPPMFGRAGCERGVACCGCRGECDFEP